MTGFVFINKSGGGLEVKTLHQCVLQTQARVVVTKSAGLPRWRSQHDGAEIVSSNLTRRITFLPSIGILRRNAASDTFDRTIVALPIAQDLVSAIIGSVEAKMDLAS
jgi:hypothetical protein